MPRSSKSQKANNPTQRAARAAPPPQLGRLWVVAISDGAFVSHPLPDAGDIVIGRNPSCDVRVDDPSISRRHAILHLGASLTIEDVGSANGTRLGQRVLEPNRPVALGVGEVVDIGSAMIIVQERSQPLRSRRVWSHDHFEGRVAGECLRAARRGTSFALLALRVEAIAMASVEDLLAGVLGPEDLVGEYAAGEIEVLLVDADEAAATKVLARLSPGMRARARLAMYPRDGRDVDQLVAEAWAEPRAGSAAPPVVLDDSAMQQLHRLVDRIAAGNISVLILGETGVGKEVLAETIHRRSPRAAQPFVRLNCAALTETWLESELFGLERGAFTGAVQATPGLLETADGGSVFLDELGEMPMSTQVKLLRVIEARQVQRVGALKARPIDVRFLAATNRDLEAEIARGGFRADLYFRLNGIALSIPPLRQRVSEIEGLARVFIAQFAEQTGRPPPALSRPALALMHQYSWPGNIRELRNVAERAVLLCASDAIGPEHLPLEKMRATYAAPAPAAVPGAARSSPIAAGPPADPGAPTRDSIRREMADLERQRLIDALAQHAGNQTATAKALGISRRTLVSRLREYKIPRPQRPG